MRRILLAAVPLAFSACATVAPDPGPHTGTLSSFDGLPITYDVRGAGEPALVFIHGWCCDRLFWNAQMEAFAAHHRVVALDLGGHGDSGREREEWTIAGLAQDVSAVADGLELESVILVGHSMGGRVSLAAASLLGDRVLGVIGVDCLQDVELEYPEEEMGSFLKSLERGFEVVTDAFVRSMFPQSADPALVQRVASTMSTADPAVGLGLMRSYGEFDARQALVDCPAPLRCINASLMSPTNVEANRRADPTFDVIEMDGVGHFPMLERPDELNAHLAVLIEELAGTATEAPEDRRSLSNGN